SESESWLSSRNESVRSEVTSAVLSPNLDAAAGNTWPSDASMNGPLNGLCAWSIGEPRIRHAPTSQSTLDVINERVTGSIYQAKSPETAVKARISTSTFIALVRHRPPLYVPRQSG